MSEISGEAESKMQWHLSDVRAVENGREAGRGDVARERTEAAGLEEEVREQGGSERRN